MKDILSEYSRIIEQERRIIPGEHLIDAFSSQEIYNTTLQIAEYADSSLVSRSYNRIYGLSHQCVAYESVGAHTNLLCAILDRAISYQYGNDLTKIYDDHGYSYRDLLEAARRHDLAENTIGDLPDNDMFNRETKFSKEMQYHKNFSSLYPSREVSFSQNIDRLFVEMEEKSSWAGRLLYSADKISAIIITLQLDEIGSPPLMEKNAEEASRRDKAEMEICENPISRTNRHGHKTTYYRASEMWTMDWLKIRNLVQYDDSLFFTALVVMRTLQVNRKWYKWREKDYW